MTDPVAWSSPERWLTNIEAKRTRAAVEARKSAINALYTLGVQAEATLHQDLRRCQHPQAEPVIPTTGELVACVCIGCYEQLSADYIEQQAERAHLAAYCRHSGTRFVQSTCSECGSQVSKGTWPNL